MSRKIMALAIFVVSLVLYVLTLAPSLGSYEGSAWIVNGMYAGLPSAPGNLLYLLSGSLMAKLYEWTAAPLLMGIAKAGDSLGYIFRPSLEPAVGVNLISAISVALSAALSFTLLDRVMVQLRGERNWPDGAGRWLLGVGIMFLFTIPVLWQAAVTAGPWGFNLMLLTFFCWMMVRCEEQPAGAGTRMLIVAFLAGLAFSHNLVFILLAVMVAAFARSGKTVWPALKANIGPAVMLFLVGCSLYLYAWVRPQPVPGLGDPLELFSKSFWKYLFNLPAVAHSLPRQGNFFTLQVPLMAGRLEDQADYWIAGIAMLVLFHYGMVLHLKSRVRGGWWILAALAVALLVPMWLYNPGLGSSEGFDKQLLVFMAMIGGWMLIGITLLYVQLIGAARRFQAKMEFTTRRFEHLVTVVLIVLLIGGMLTPMYARWLDSNMSSYYVIRDLGVNQLLGVEDNGILILSGSAEYYRTLYAERIMFKDSKRSLINHPAMASRRYISELKAGERSVPMDMSAKEIDDLRPARLDKAESFQAGELKVSYPAKTIFLLPDLALMSILRANKFERPVYFSSSVAPQNMLGLSGYCALRGLAVKLFEQDPLTTKDSTNYWRGERNKVAVDIPWTQQLLWGYYVHHTTLWQAPGDKTDPRYRPLLVYAQAHANLAEALLGKENGEGAASNFRQCEFFDPEYNAKLLNFAIRLAQEKQYDQSKDFASMYFKTVPPDPLKWAGLAKLALANNDTVPATEMLIKSLDADQDFLLGYQKLIRLYDSMGKTSMVSAFLSRWLAHHPSDQETRKLWEDYNATKTLPPNFPD